MWNAGDSTTDEIRLRQAYGATGFMGHMGLMSTPIRRDADTPLRFTVPLSQSQLLKSPVDIPEVLPQRTEPR
jgi:hypothetical protein